MTLTLYTGLSLKKKSNTMNYVEVYRLKIDFTYRSTTKLT